MEEVQLSPMQPSKFSMKPDLIDVEALPDEEGAGVSDASSSNEAAPGNLLADSIEQGKTLLNEHKGKLAIGVAATLGLMVFYKWRDKKLAEEDPEEYARLQRIKAVVREEEGNAVRRLEDDE